MVKDRIKQFRKAKGWTQDELAERSGYSRNSIINWESGKRAPRTTDIEKLAITLEVLPSEFLDDFSTGQIQLPPVIAPKNIEDCSNKLFVKNLVRLRKINKLNQQDLADAIEVSRNSIINWETGKSEPKASDIQKMATVLGVSPNDFFIDSVNTQTQVKIATAKPSDNAGENFAYWGGVLDKALKIAECQDIYEIDLIVPLLQSALNTLLAAQTHIKGENQTSYV